MKIELVDPMFISSRLLPAVEIAGVTISQKITGRSFEGRLQTRLYFDSPDFNAEVEGANSGCWTEYNSDSVIDLMSANLEFLVHYTDEWRNFQPEAKDVYPDVVYKWASNNLDEIQLLGLDLADSL